MSKYAAKKAAERIATDPSRHPVVLKCQHCEGWSVEDVSDSRVFINALVDGLTAKMVDRGEK
jgi:hypothetical protein